MSEILLNKTNWYLKIKLKRVGIAMVRAGAAIPVDDVNDCELLCLNLKFWELQ